jgi:hypothetical protein
MQQPTMNAGRCCDPLRAKLRYAGKGKYAANYIVAASGLQRLNVGALRELLWFWRKSWSYAPPRTCASVSRKRIIFVALCLGLDTDAKIHQPSSGSSIAGDVDGCAASFLKHKL